MRRVGLLLLLAGCVAPVPRPAGETATVKLIAFNDFHGHLAVPVTPMRVPGPGETELQLPTGGVAWLAGQIAALRRENPRSVVVAAGDLIGGSPLVSSLLNHEPTINALGEAGLAFSAVGNHEFDRGVPELLRLASLARFGYLAANVRHRDTGRPLFPAWASRQLRMPGGGELRIAFIGAVLRDTPSLVNGNAVAGLTFLDEAEAANAVVTEIRAAGIEAIVLLIHEGGFTDQPRFDDATCPGFRGPILGIVERLDPAIDVVVSGHTHRAYVCRHAGRLITSAGNEGRIVTDIDLMVDTATGDVREARARQLPVINDSRPNPLADVYPGAPPDRRLRQRVTRWAGSVAPLARRPVGSTTAPLTRRPNDSGETSLGAFIADAELALTAAPEDGGAQIAFVNNGGLRADLAAPGGAVTYENIFAVHPFGNRMVTLTLTGSQIDELLETQWQGAGSLLQVSRGFQFRWSASRPPGERIAPGDILLDGRPLEPDGLYRVTVNDFLHGGGDGYAVLKQGRDVVTGLTDVEVLERYLDRVSPASPPAPGRIVKLP